MRALKNSIHLVCFMFGVAVILVYVMGWMNGSNYTKLLSNSMGQIVNEEENISIVNLYVVEKVKEPIGMMGVFAEYHLKLSNDMTVLVGKEEFEKYEINQYYDFELIQNIWVSQKIKNLVW